MRWLSSVKQQFNNYHKMSMNVLNMNAPSANATASIIMIHGLGSSSDDMKHLTQSLYRTSKFDHVNFVLPDAPVRPLTISGGALVPRWFDVFALGNANARQDEDGYWESVQYINKLIENEINKGIDPSKIIVGGFSQGASLSLGVAATTDKKLGGFVSLSGFFAMKQGISSKYDEINKNTPIFHGHGDMDQVINFNYGKSTATYFKEELGFTNYQFHEYIGMPHSTCSEELQDLVDFLGKII